MDETPIIQNTDETLDDPAVNAEIVEPAVETILQAAPAEKRKEVLEALTIIQQESFSGPIPHPRIMAGYEQVLPGSADRILKMAERQQEHRFGLEKTSVESQQKSNTRGQVFGFILSFLVIIGGIVLLLLGMPILGVCLMAGMICLLAGLFIGGKISMRADLKEKRASIEAKPVKN